MGIVGRKPKPPELKLLEGNPGKRPVNRNCPQPERGDAPPKAPAWLEPDAKREWKRVAEELHSIGLLTKVDVVAMAAYCQAYARWKEAEQVLTDEGTTMEYTNKHGEKNQVLHPQVFVANKYLQIIRAFCAEFGLTPSSRGRMVLPCSEGADDFGSFLGEEGDGFAAKARTAP